MRDHQAVSTAGCEPRADHDHPPLYRPTSPRRDLDPARHEADGWGACEGLALPKIHDAGGTGKYRFWAHCPNVLCRHPRFEGRSEASVERKLREHLGTLRD